MKLCPCGSGNPYKSCCGLLHKGAQAENALQLMRSRYAAYACHNSTYIMRTTHPNNPDYKEDRKTWAGEILYFCQNTQFDGLEIVEFIDGEKEAFVTFIAHLCQHGKDATFKEKSRFEKVDGRWLYIQNEK